MKNKIKELIFKRFNVSFSKSGEDIQLNKLIGSTSPGVYVDIGCWHPIKASNTYYFYLRGWKGLCIDPNPELEILYKKFRPKDNFINCAIGGDLQSYKYYMLEDQYSSMNTLDFNFIKKHDLVDRIKKTIDVPAFSLKKILDGNINENDRLDFFDIDVEGFDLEVLKTNDWVKYRPKIVVIETDLSLKDDLSSEIVNYLESKEYRLIGKSIIIGDLGNLFLIDNKLNPCE
jgi:FkbM family methyltransferase